MQEFLTREETADILNISTRTLDRYVRKKILKPHRDGRRTVFKKTDVESVVETPSEKPQIVSESKENISLPEKQDANIAALATLAKEMHDEMKRKDEQIANLNFELGKMQESSKTTIPLLAMKEKESENERREYKIREQLQTTRIIKNVYLILFGLSIAIIGIMTNYLVSFF